MRRLSQTDGNVERARWDSTWAEENAVGMALFTTFCARVGKPFVTFTLSSMPTEDNQERQLVIKMLQFVVEAEEDPPLPELSALNQLLKDTSDRHLVSLVLKKPHYRDAFLQTGIDILMDHITILAEHLKLNKCKQKHDDVREAAKFSVLCACVGVLSNGFRMQTQTARRARPSRRRSCFRTVRALDADTSCSRPRTRRCSSSCRWETRPSAR